MNQEITMKNNKVMDVTNEIRQERERRKNLVSENICKAMKGESFSHVENVEKAEVNDDIQKAHLELFGDSIEKAVYADTPQNRKLGRVGQEWHRGKGGNKEVGAEKHGRAISENKKSGMSATPFSKKVDKILTHSLFCNSLQKKRVLAGIAKDEDISKKILDSDFPEGFRSFKEGEKEKEEVNTIDLKNGEQIVFKMTGKINHHGTVDKEYSVELHKDGKVKELGVDVLYARSNISQESEERAQGLAKIKALIEYYN